MENAFFISLIITYLVVFLFMFLSKKDPGTNSNILKLHAIYLILGLFSLAGFSIFEIGSIYSHDILAMSIFSAFVFLSLLLIIAYFNCRLFFFDTYVISQNFFRIRKRINYDDFVTIKKENGTVFLRTEKNKIKISQYMVGKREFFKSLKPYKNQIKNLNDVPLGAVPRVLKYKDAVNNYGEFVFAIIVFILFEIATLIIAGLNMFLFKKYEFVVFFLSLFVLLCLVHFVTIQSAKRHHSSKFWAFVSKYTYKEGCLKDPYNRTKENPWSVN